MTGLPDPKQFIYHRSRPALGARVHKPPRHRTGEKFLKGPIPLHWLAAAARLPGKALHVANVLWYLAGLRGSRTVALSNQVLAQFGVDRHAKYRALRQLEKAGLVRVERQAGSNPAVTPPGDQVLAPTQDPPRPHPAVDVPPKPGANEGDCPTGRTGRRDVPTGSRTD